MRPGRAGRNDTRRTGCRQIGHVTTGLKAVVVVDADQGRGGKRPEVVAALTGAEAARGRFVAGRRGGPVSCSGSTLPVTTLESRRGQGPPRRPAPGWCPAARPAGRRTAAILALFTEWGEIDRSHRKLAHRGSRLGLVHVSESTVLRVLAAEGIALPGNPRGTRSPGAVAGLVGMETEPHLGLRLHPLHPGPAGRDRDPGHGVPQVADHRWSRPRNPPPRSRSRSPPRWTPRACPRPPSPGQPGAAGRAGRPGPRRSWPS